MQRGNLDELSGWVIAGFLSATRFFNESSLPPQWEARKFAANTQALIDNDGGFRHAPACRFFLIMKRQNFYKHSVWRQSAHL